MYKLKLNLADAWNIKLETDAEKVREVARLIRDKVNKSHCDAAKEANMNKEEKKNEIVTTDSGIDVLSLEKLIYEKVAVT